MSLQSEHRPARSTRHAVVRPLVTALGALALTVLLRPALDLTDGGSPLVYLAGGLAASAAVLTAVWARVSGAAYARACAEGALAVFFALVLPALALVLIGGATST